MSQNLFLPIKSEYYNRKTVLIASPEKLNEISEYNWSEILLDTFVPFRQLYKIFNKENLKNDYLDVPKFVLPIEDARNEFTFPVDHPIDGEIYACSELAPNHYMPLKDFNQNQYNSKMHDFIALCASLGAKSCSVIKYEEKGVEKSIEAETLNIPTNIGSVSTEVKVNTTATNENLNSMIIQFSEPIEKYPEFKSRWIQDEDTWGKLADMRNNYGTLNYKVSFEYKDTQLFEGAFGGKLNKTEMKLKKTSSEEKDFKIEFNVEFWPKKNFNLKVKRKNIFSKIWSWFSNLF